MNACRFMWKAISTSPPSLPMHPLERYGILILILGLLAGNLWWYLGLSPTYDGDPYMLFVVVLVGLFNHLAYSFEWRPAVAVALRALAWGWIVFACLYVFYLTRILYP